MLVLSRKKGESIIIDGRIEVKVIAVEGDLVKLGIEAPETVSVHRMEVYQAIQEENRAALLTRFDSEWLKRQVSPIQEEE